MPCLCATMTPFGPDVVFICTPLADRDRDWNEIELSPLFSKRCRENPRPEEQRPETREDMRGRGERDQRGEGVLAISCVCAGTQTCTTIGFGCRPGGWATDYAVTTNMLQKPSLKFVAVRYELTRRSICHSLRATRACLPSTLPRRDEHIEMCYTSAGSTLQARLPSETAGRLLTAVASATDVFVRSDGRGRARLVGGLGMGLFWCAPPCVVGSM